MVGLFWISWKKNCWWHSFECFPLSYPVNGACDVEWSVISLIFFKVLPSKSHSGTTVLGFFLYNCVIPSKFSQSSQLFLHCFSSHCVGHSYNITLISHTVCLVSWRATTHLGSLRGHQLGWVLIFHGQCWDSFDVILEKPPLLQGFKRIKKTKDLPFCESIWKIFWLLSWNWICT